jgi:hypothetical protein
LVLLEAIQQRLDAAPEKMLVRRQTVEHPFGTIKAWMGGTHFLTKTLGRVSTEMSLHVLEHGSLRLTRIWDSGAGESSIQDAGWAGGQHLWAVLIRWIFGRALSLRCGLA